MTSLPVGSTLFNGIQFSDPNDIEAQLLNFGAVRSGVLEDAVRANNAEQSARNQNIADLNRALQVLQSIRPDPDTAGTLLSRQPSAEELQLLRGVLVDENGVSLFDQAVSGGNVTSDGAFQNLLNRGRDLVDQATANSQLELIQLQALINRRNQAVEFTTNLVQRFSSLRDRIIGNLRN